MDIKELYNENKAFRDIVDRNCKSYGLSVEECLKMAIMQEIAKDIQARAEGKY